MVNGMVESMTLLAAENNLKEVYVKTMSVFAKPRGE